jgi:hypothetical protein
MRIPHVPLTVLAAALATGLSLEAPAQAQLPFPFGPAPDLGKAAQCTRERTNLLGQQLEALEKLRSAGPEAIGRLCGLIAMGSAWLGKDPEARAKLRELLGVDVDLERAEAQCRAGQDTIASELTTAIARLKAELLRCDDTI